MEFPPHIFVIFEFIQIKYISTFICQIEREREKEREREREREREERQTLTLFTFLLYVDEYRLYT